MYDHRGRRVHGDFKVDAGCRASPSCQCWDKMAGTYKKEEVQPMNIRPVQSKLELDQFIDLPYQLYKQDPLWVPPLRDEQKGQFDAGRNPLLKHCEWQLFLLEQDGKIIGRIAAFIDGCKTAVYSERRSGFKRPVG